MSSSGPDVLSLIELAIPLLLLLLGLSAGTILERRHMKQLAEREAAVAGVRVTNLRTFPAEARSATLVVTEVALSIDYFRSFLGRLRNIFGGRVGVYERMTMRARREALLRLIDQAHALGYEGLSNVKFEFVTIGVGQKQPVVQSSVIASATAWSSQPARR